MAGAASPDSSADALAYYSLVILLAHLGCFFFFSSSSAPPTTDPPTATKQPSQLTRKRRISPISCAFPQRDPPDSAKQREKDTASARSASLVPDFVIRCSLRQLFSFHKPHQPTKQQPTLPAHDSLPSLQSPDLASPDLPPVRTSVGIAATSNNNAASLSDNSEIATPNTGAAVLTSSSSSSHSSFSARGDVHPCATCGDVFPRPHLLDLHHSARHAFADLPETESGGGIVRIIFLSGWKPAVTGASPIVRRVLRIRNPQRAMQRFEDCRDAVRARAAERKAKASGDGGGKDGGDLERCVADGNERLRFVGATYVCGGLQGKKEGEGLGTCGSGMCRVCGIVRHGFGGKAAAAEEEGGVTTYATGWAAHAALTLDTEAEEELTFLHARKAVIVCRAVAGRVTVGVPAVSNELKEEDARGNTGGGSRRRNHEEYDEFDSVVVSGNAGETGGSGPQDQMVVLNPRAVLPCFIILYTA